jgi:hypothetical protein
MLRLSFAAVVAAFVVSLSGAAQASPVCSSEYNSSNGGQTLGTATNIGSVSSGCEIGNFGNSTTINSSASAVNDASNPSIYAFTWVGGNLTIAEQIGNDGIGNIINVELGSTGVSLNTDGSLSAGTGTIVASLPMPFNSGVGPEVDVINNMALAAGTYYLDTYLGPCAPGHSCSNSGTSTDPNYAVQFSPGVSATPLPATLPMFVGGLGFVGLLARRKKRKAQADLAAA